MSSHYSQLTKAETARNTHGPSIMFTHTPVQQDTYVSSLPEAFPDIRKNHALHEEVPLGLYCIDGNKLRKGLLPSVRLEVYYAGFPTLMHIKHTACLKKEGVKVFQMNSRGENMTLTITQTEEDQNISLEEASNLYLGKCVYVGWPHLHEAQVIEICDGENRHVWKESKAEKGQKSSYEKIVRKLEKDAEAVWRREVGSIKEKYHDRLGVHVGFTNIVLYALPMTGRRYTCGSHGKITLEKQFCVRPVPYALQATVKDIATYDDDFQQFKTWDELFTTDTTVFMLGNPHYGSQGEVTGIEDGRIKVSFVVPYKPNLTSVQKQQHSLQTNYMPGYILAQKLGISGLFVSRITGSILIVRGMGDNPSAGKVNIGLNLKHSKRNQALPGYTKKINDKWTYSQATLDIVRQYINKFPDVFDILLENAGDDMMNEGDLFPAEGEYKLKDLQDFVKGLPCNDVKPMSTDADVLEEGVVKAIEVEVDLVNEENKNRQKRVKMSVKPHLLFRPTLNQGPVVPDQSTVYCLYDRVVVVKTGYPVPMGMYGTVVGIHIDHEKEVDTLYDVVFDQEFIGGISVRCSAHRGYRVPAATLVNLSHGERKEAGIVVPREGEVRGPRQTRGNWASQGSDFGGSSSSNYSNLLKGRNGGQNQAPHMQWGSAEQRPRGEGAKHKDQNGRDHFNPEFRMKHNTRDKSPKFVTPKISTGQISKRTPPTRRAQNVGKQVQPPTPEMSNSSEFATMWKELQNSTGKSTSTTFAATQPANDDIISQELSLQQAALALGQITLPSPKAELPEDQNQSGNVKIDLQNLFDQASRRKEATEDDEFIAMMDSLGFPEQPESNTEACKSLQKPEQDSSATLKTILKIGSEEIREVDNSVPITSTPSTASYGRQLSVQELFDSAKNHDKSPNATPTKKSKTSDSKLKQSHHKQSTEQNVSHDGPGPLPPSPPKPLSGNPVLDLGARCQLLGLGLPGYDFKCIKGLYTSMVMLANGARFEGSQCQTKEEAAESAAGRALLHLQSLDRQHVPPFMNIPPPRMMMVTPPYPSQHLRSPNSAFSTVRPGQVVSGFMPREGYSMNRHRRHQFPDQMQQQFAGQGYHGGRQPHYPTNQNTGIEHDVDQRSKTTEHKNDIDPAFIPLQVVKKQKTPRKHRDSQGEGNVENDVNSNRPEPQPSQQTPHKQEQPTSQKTEPRAAPSSRGRRRQRIAANFNFS